MNLEVARDERQRALAAGSASSAELRYLSYLSSFHMFGASRTGKDLHYKQCVPARTRPLPRYQLSVALTLFSLLADICRSSTTTCCPSIAARSPCLTSTRSSSVSTKSLSASLQTALSSKNGAAMTTATITPPMAPMPLRPRLRQVAWRPRALSWRQPVPEAPTAASTVKHARRASPRRASTLLISRVRSTSVPHSV